MALRSLALSVDSFSRRASSCRASCAAVWYGNKNRSSRLARNPRCSDAALCRSERHRSSETWTSSVRLTHSDSCVAERATHHITRLTSTGMVRRKTSRPRACK